MINNEEDESLTFFIYSRALEFASRVAVELSIFRDMREQGEAVEDTLKRMCDHISGNRDDGFTFDYC